MKSRDIQCADLQLSRNARNQKSQCSTHTSQISRTSKPNEKVVFQSARTGSSLNSVSTSENYFNVVKPAQRSERSRNFQDTSKKLAALTDNVKKQADRAIISANKVANETLNKKSEYESVERQQPEMELIDHFRHINQRVLNAEEQDVMLQCTPLYCEGTEYRRFLPNAIGRRAQMCNEDIQETYLKMESERCITDAYKVLSERKREEDALFEALVQSTIE